MIHASPRVEDVAGAVLLVLAAVVADPTPLLETSTVSFAGLFGGLVRFAVLRSWVFGRDTAPPVERGRRIRELWRVHGRWAMRIVVTLAAGTALVLTSAGACTAVHTLGHTGTDR